MKLFSRLRVQRYCAFCKSQRRMYLKKHVDLTNVVGAGLLSATVMMTIWGDLDPRGLGLFGGLIFFSELLVYLRWRNAVVCKMCGFDPVLYKRSPEEAAKRVRTFFDEQVQNPRFQLSKSPLLELRRRQQAQERKRLEHRYPVVAPKVPVIDPRAP